MVIFQSSVFLVVTSIGSPTYFDYIIGKHGSIMELIWLTKLYDVIDFTLAIFSAMKHCFTGAFTDFK